MEATNNQHQTIQVVRHGIWILLLLLPSPSTPFLGRFLKSRSLRLDDSLADDYFMQLAIVQAKSAAQCREVPVGCVVVQRVVDGDSQHYRYRLLSQAHNRVEQLHDASAHAELLALRHAGRQLKNWRLSAPSTSRKAAARTPPSSNSMVTTLYSTCEPCLTCWSACHAFRVQRIVYGTDDLRLGAVTAFRMNETSSTTTHHPFHTIAELKGGVRKEECADLLRAFFRQRRKETTAATKMKH